VSWFKVDDHLHSHRKAMRAGVEAMGLWVLAGSWSAAEESDGWVPGYVLGRLVGANGEALAGQLVGAGLWHPGEKDGEDGYVFHSWEDFQPTRASLEAKRAAQRERMRENRAKDKGGARAAKPAPKPKPAKSPAPLTDAAFTEFWSIYPRKTAKATAQKAFAKACEQAPPDRIIDGLRNSVQAWTAAHTEPKYIPHPATWLNGGRWDDEQPMPGMPERPQAAPPSKTLAQCPNHAPHERHDWSNDGRNAFVCMGT
jgi:hypothetical protein